MFTIRETAWLAGLLEGEGYFGFTGKVRTGRPRSGTPRIDLLMTSRDIVERAALMLGTRVHPNKVQVATWKPQFRTTLAGNRAAAWMMTLYLLMGIERRRKIRSVLESWRLVPAKNNNARVIQTDSIVEGRPCLRCHRLLTFESFPKSKRGRRHGECRHCMTARTRAWLRKRRLVHSLSA